MSEAIHEEETSTSTHTLTQQVVTCLYERKAREIVIYNVEGRTSYCDRLILCSGTAGRQVRALAEHVAAVMKQSGNQPLGIEGGRSSSWVLVDLGDVVVHIFDEESRLHYDLDGMWADAEQIPLSSLGVSEDVAAGAETAPFLS